MQSNIALVPNYCARLGIWKKLFYPESIEHNEELAQEFESTKLHKKGLVDQSEVADDLDTIVDEYDTDAFDEDLFDTLNGFDSSPVNRRFPF